MNASQVSTFVKDKQQTDRQIDTSSIKTPPNMRGHWLNNCSSNRWCALPDKTRVEEFSFILGQDCSVCRKFPKRYVFHQIPESKQQDIVVFKSLIITKYRACM